MMISSIVPGTDRGQHELKAVNPIPQVSNTQDSQNVLGRSTRDITYWVFARNRLNIAGRLIASRIASASSRVRSTC